MTAKKTPNISSEITKTGKSLENTRNKMKKLGITDKDITDSVKWSRKKNRQSSK